MRTKRRKIISMLLSLALLTGLLAGLASTAFAVTHNVGNATAFDAAIGLLADGDIINLTADITIVNPTTIGRSVTINTNGYKLNFTGGLGIGTGNTVTINGDVIASDLEVYESILIVNGNVEIGDGQLHTSVVGIITVTGSIFSLADTRGSNTPLVYAHSGTITIGGNVSADYGAGVGTDFDGTVIIDGEIIIPIGNDYIILGANTTTPPLVIKQKSDGVPSTVKPGYLEYIEGPNLGVVYVRIASATARASKEESPLLPTPVIYDIVKSGDSFTFKAIIANARGSQAGRTMLVSLNGKYSTTVTLDDKGFGNGTLNAKDFGSGTAIFAARLTGSPSNSVAWPMFVTSSGKVTKN